MPPVKYRCPHCSARIESRPEYAGERVLCSKCQGAYFEPTDPLPGVLPEKAPPNEEHAPSGPESVIAAAGASPTSSATEPAKPVATPVSRQQLTESLEPFDMVMEMKRRGLQSVMISLSPSFPEDASVVFSDNLTPDEVNDILLRIAANIMESKWPDVYQLIASRLK